MPKIQVLPDILASQVAAGEVVERPASVVKELVENSIDANASNIEVLVKRGGVSLIRVVDDGTGMNRRDAEMALERHATSKLRTSDELTAITTLGFRGEALPSIASVSKFRLITREREALTGTEVAVEGGKVVQVRDSGEAPGTQIEVRSLFFNVPARRKFLKREQTEFGHIEQVVRAQALAYPDIAFTLVHNDRLVFQLPPCKDLLERIAKLYGNYLAGNLLLVPPHEAQGIRVTGYIGGPGMARSNRSQQLVFLNGRVAESAMIQYGLREGFHTALVKGQHPVAFLFLEMDPATVDVNVHPAKKEVRFHQGQAVRSTLSDAVAQALKHQIRAADYRQKDRSRERAGPALMPEREPQAPGRRSVTGPVVTPVALVGAEQQPNLIPEREQQSLRGDWADPGLKVEGQDPPATGAPVTEQEQEQEPSSVETAAAAGLPEFRVVGSIGKRYAILEASEGLVLMHLRAARERVLFEEARKRMEKDGVPAQKLLLPFTLQLVPKDFDFLQQNLGSVQKLGFGIEAFGQDTFKVDSIPYFVTDGDPETFLNELVEELQRAASRANARKLKEEVVVTTVCHHATRYRAKLKPEEIRALTKNLLACEMPYCCPLGKPTIIQMSFPELDKKFGR